MDLTGTLVGGRYFLEARIGEGGMGSVWRATDRTLERLVAVKVLYSGDERERDLRVSRFLREARIAAAVQHRNVVHIVDFGSTDEGRPFMVMEHLRGETLADRLAQAPAPTVGELVDWVGLVLAGLAAAHDAGVVHRDMKPENVFLVEDADGAYPKILDFGISRSMAPESGPRSALTTREGFLVGTPQYMSPEQARGLEGIDHRTDLYSVGVILYEALTGMLPHDSENIGDLIILIAAGGARPVSEVRPELGEPLSEVVRKATAVDRDARFEDARAMRDALLDARERTAEEALALSAKSRRRRSGLPPAAPADVPKTSAARTVPARAGRTPAETASALAKTLPARRTPDADVPPPTPSIETPRAWTVAEEGAKRGRGRAVWLAVAALVAAAGASVAVTRGGGEADPGDPIARPASAGNPAPLVPETTEPETTDVPDPEPAEPPTEPLGAAEDAGVDAGREPVEPVRRTRGDRATKSARMRAPAVRMRAPQTPMAPPATIRDLDY